MNHRQRYLRNSEVGIDNRTPEETIIDLVNILIRHLYRPMLGCDGIELIDNIRLKEFDIDNDEPINWASLRCAEVRVYDYDNTLYIATVDEAMEDMCPTFCDYIERFMKSWGWNVRVETEW